MQALKRRFKRSAEDEADDPDADIQRGMWKNHKLLPPALPAKVRYWDPLLLICSLYFFVTLPLILCFGLQPSIGWLVRARITAPSSALPRRADQTHLRGDRPQARPPAVAVGRAQGRQVAVVEAVVEGGGGRGGGPRVHAQAGARPRRQGRLHRLEHVVGRRGVDGDVARVGLCVGW